MKEKSKDVFNYKAVLIAEQERFEFADISDNEIKITTADRQEIYTPNKINDISVHLNSNKLIQFIQ